VDAARQAFPPGAAGAPLAAPHIDEYFFLGFAAAAPTSQQAPVSLWPTALYRRFPVAACVPVVA